MKILLNRANVHFNQHQPLPAFIFNPYLLTLSLSITEPQLPIKHKQQRVHQPYQATRP